MNKLRATFILALLGLLGCGSQKHAGGNTSELPNAIAQVMLEDGAPARNARVFLRSRSYQPPLSLERVEAARLQPDHILSQNGDLSISVPDTGWWTLEIDADSQGVVVSFHADSLEILMGTVKLSKWGVLQGFVDTSGFSSGAWVVFPGQERLVLLSGDGQFLSANIPMGTGSLEVRKDAPSSSSVVWNQDFSLRSDDTLNLGVIRIPALDSIASAGLTQSLVDNFEDGDAISWLPWVSGDSGQFEAWHTSSDESLGGTSLVTSLNVTGNRGLGIQLDTLAKGHIAYLGCLFGDTLSTGLLGFCNMGLDFAPEGEGRDLRDLKAIHFRYRSSHYVRAHWVFLDTANPLQWYGKLYASLPSTSEWKWARINMVDLLPEKDTPVETDGLLWPDLASRARVFNLEMGGVQGESLDLWIDDVTLEWNPN